MKKIFENYIWIRFLLVGLINTLVGYGLFVLFIFFGAHYALAVLLSTILGVAFNFKSIGLVVFKSKDNKRIFSFILVYVFLYVLNVFGLWLLSKTGLNNMYIAGAILLLPMALLSFFLNKKFVFCR